jgi:hypothetical protein
MVYPMFGSIFSERKFFQTIVGNVLLEMKQHAYTGLRDECMGGCHRNVIAGNSVAGFGKASRCQELSD